MKRIPVVLPVALILATTACAAVVPAVGLITVIGLENKTYFQEFLKSSAKEEKNKNTATVVEAPKLDLKKNLNEENNNQVKAKIEGANKVGSSTSVKKTVESDVEKKSVKDEKILEKKSEEQVTALETKKKLANENSSDKKTNQKSVKTKPM